jgi:hypothetical protein
MVNPNTEIETLEIVETLNSVDFEVGLERLTLANGTPTPAFATVRKDNGAVLGVVGERYTPMQNSVLFPAVEQVFRTSGHRFESKGFKVVDGGRQVRAQFRFPDIVVKMPKGDESCLQILVQNSFDGSLKVAFDLGFFRFICSNGLKVPAFKGSTFSLMKKHTASLNLEFTGHALEQSINSVQDARQVFSEWASTRLTQTQGHKVLNGLVTAKAMTARMSDGVREIWDKPSYEQDSERNVWSLYNATTQHLTHNVAPKRFNLSERVNSEVSSVLRTSVRKGIDSLFVDTLPKRGELN